MKSTDDNPLRVSCLPPMAYLHLRKRCWWAAPSTPRTTLLWRVVFWLRGVRATPEL